MVMGEECVSFLRFSRWRSASALRPILPGAESSSFRKKRWPSCLRQRAIDREGPLEKSPRTCGRYSQMDSLIPYQTTERQLSEFLEVLL